MNIFISYSMKDHAVVQSIKDLLQESDFHVLLKRGGLELFSSLTTRGRRRIDLSNVCVVILSPAGKGSYPVHQEMGYMHITGKDHFILESNGGAFILRQNRFGKELPALENERVHEAWEQIRSILENFIHSRNAVSSKMIFHTDIILE